MAGPGPPSRPAGDSAAADHAATIPLSFVVCGSDDEVLQANVLSSPCLHQGCPHEFTVIKNCPSAAGGLNRGLERARHEWVVCLHQDVVLSEGWDRCISNPLREAERQFGPIGVAGVYGVGDAIAPAEPGGAFSAARTGWVVDRGRVLRDGPELPARVTTLDELLLVVRRDAGLRFEPALGLADLAIAETGEGSGALDGFGGAAHRLCRPGRRGAQARTQHPKLDPEDAEPWFRKAAVHRQRGESAESERSWRLILSLKRPDQFCSFDQGIYGHLTRRNLAALAAERGDQTEARRLWADVLAECPDDRDAVAKLEQIYLTRP